MVSLAQESRASDSWSSPRRSSHRSRRGNDGPRIGCARGASRTIHGRRSVGVSHSPRAAVPKRGAEPPQGHEESTIPKATTHSAGPVGTAISRNAELLARIIHIHASTDYF